MFYSDLPTSQNKAIKAGDDVEKIGSRVKGDNQQSSLVFTIQIDLFLSIVLTSELALPVLGT